MMSNLPVIDFGSPSIFFDSHPEEQDSFLSSYWTSLKSSFKIAFTGQVPKFHEPGKLRIIWWTQDGNQGMKDYDLHQYGLVRDNFDVLLAMPEVHRVVIMGYAGQNPYIIGDRGANPWAEKFGRESQRARVDREKAAVGARGMKSDEEEVDEERTKERMDASKEGRVGKLVDIEKVIEENDRAEEEARKKEDERIVQENTGLLSGEMV